MKNSASEKLIQWYKENARPLPWRKDKDPYRIWISEVMLQQTTVSAVIPYYEKFMSRFPNLKSLAEAEQGEVYKYWAGLGYYSRARNLKKASEEIHKRKRFPKTHKELLELPGFGPYTARAVSSIAFSEPVGVLDGNVIRVLSRFHSFKCEWWKRTDRNKLQILADQMVKGYPSDIVNQALMELGATLCTPKNPKCILCPWLKLCKAKKTGVEGELPLSKSKRSSEVWVWRPQVQTRDNKFYFEENHYAPFLKKAWLPPGEAKQVKAKPKEFDFCHSITHHKIYVQIDVQNRKKSFKMKSCQSRSKGRWLSKGEIESVIPASLVKKTINYVQKKQSQNR